MGGWIKLGRGNNGTENRGREGIGGAASANLSCRGRGCAQPQLGPNGRADRIGGTRPCRWGRGPGAAPTRQSSGLFDRPCSRRGGDGRGRVLSPPTPFPNPQACNTAPPKNPLPN